MKESGLSHELCYAVSDHPTEGFSFGGTLVSIADLGYKGNQIKCSRQACAEPLTILPDGSIPQVQVSSCGLNGGPLAGKGIYEARIACNLGGQIPMVKSDTARRKDKKKRLPYFTQSGEDREKDGDQYIANLKDGGWAGYKCFAFEGTERKICLEVRGNGTGNIRIYCRKKVGPAAVVPVQPSASWQTYAAGMTVSPGVAPLYFVYRGSGAVDFRAFEIQ